MSVKPWLASSVALLTSAGALGIVVASNDPTSTTVFVLGVVWAAIFCAVASLILTILLVCRCALVPAVWIGLLLGMTAIGTLVLQRYHFLESRLLVGIVSATLVLTVFVIYSHARTEKNH